MKVTVKGFISVDRKAWDEEDQYLFYWHRESFRNFVIEKLGETIIADYDIEIEAPDNLDDLIRDNTLKSLQEKRKITLAENQNRINEIDRQISELLAIENKA